MVKQKMDFIMMYSSPNHASSLSETIAPKDYHVYDVQLPYRGPCTFYNESKYGITYRGYLFFSGEFSGKYYYQGVIYKAGVSYPIPKGEQILY